MGMREIITSRPGGIVNQYKERKRRNVAFFDEPFSLYLKALEKEGHGKEVEEIGFIWGSSYTAGIIHQMADRPAPLGMINNSMQLLWKAMGLLDSCTLVEDSGKLIFKTSNECFSRTIGKNPFNTGLYKGVFSALYGKRLEDVSSYHNGKDGEYVYRMTEQSFVPECKESELYYRLNDLPEGRAYTLDDAKRDGLVTSSGPHLFLNGKPLQLIESTLFHVASGKGLKMERLATITSEYLKGSAPKTGVPILIKHFLELGGWGLAKVEASEKEVKISLSNPPHGFQIGKDDWSFVSMTVLGMLKCFSNASLKSSKLISKTLFLEFSV